jgi:hypothetical protein
MVVLESTLDRATTLIMESLKLLRLLPVLVLIFGSAVAGDELRTFIVHVFSTADDRTAW